jgi:hypothetical protein
VAALQWGPQTGNEFLTIYRLFRHCLGDILSPAQSSGFCGEGIQVLPVRWCNNIELSFVVCMFFHPVWYHMTVICGEVWKTILHIQIHTDDELKLWGMQYWKFLDRNFKQFLIICSLVVKHIWELKEVIFNTCNNMWLYYILQIVNVDYVGGLCLKLNTL